ncbi:hypothetical protein VULLAG_LOCUS17457 [Vulpes lagopus]
MIALATFAQVLHREFVVCQTGQGILVEASFFEKFKKGAFRAGDVNTTPVPEIINHLE